MRTSVTTTRASLILAGLLSAALLAGCSSRGTSSSTDTAPSSTTPGPALASAAVGSLVITGGYIPQPASPDVAAAYLTITNNGDTADTLTKVTTSVTSSVMAMNETDSGGVGSMTDLSEVAIPAHASLQFIPNHAHLMLEKPKPIKAGDQVAMSLTFTPAGTVNITLPVLPLSQSPTTGPAPATTAPPGSSSSIPATTMNSMPGMSMPGS